ncbi:hypothetical protein C1H46_044520 [Malus baccata]|uniref:Uncharacterized protein n=1 Tax=Malus baccata TaxID=106549 RepID=A0A540K6U9_MALBA|nr:hypothetical protein C1H46_044520 [Malus baccata]
MENGVLTVTVQKEMKRLDEGCDGLNLVPLIFIKSFAPSKNGAGAGVVIGRLLEDGVGPAFTHAFDQGLKVLHEDTWLKGVADGWNCVPTEALG